MKHLLGILLVAGAAFTAGAATVDELIPKLSDSTVGNRYAAQMELQALAAAAAKPGNEAARAAFAGTLAGKATDASVPQAARVWIVRQLESMGGGEAVPALTTLLSGDDAELRECARRALEKNPDAKAADSLRAALQKGGDTAWKIGLMRSLGEKHDEASVALIASVLNDPDLGSAAAKALGLIGSIEAIDALAKVLETQPVAAEALLDAVDYRLSVGKRNGAVGAADKLYKSKLPAPIRAAALALLAKGDADVAKQYLEPALTGSDTRLQKAAVDAALVIYGNRASTTLAGMLPKLPATAKAFVLRAVDADPAAEKATVECVADQDAEVRLAALDALGRIGTAYSVPALIKTAATGTDAEKNVAVASLSVINGGSAGDAIAKLAMQGDAAARIVAINALGARADRAQLPSLLRFGGEADAAVSKAALSAIAKFGGDESLDGLVKLVLAGKPGAKDALLTVSSRSKDKSLVGRKLVAQAQGATGPQLAGILEVMALVGGQEALDTVVKLATTGSEETKDGAIRALCNWHEFAAVKPLLEVAGAPGAKLVHQVLAIQAVCRLVKSEEQTDSGARVAAALAALKVASRDQEKKQVLSALVAVKNRAAADAILKLLADPTVRNDAGEAALNLADALGKADKGSAKKLAKAVKEADIAPNLTKRADGLLKKYS